MLMLMMPKESKATRSAMLFVVGTPFRTVLKIIENSNELPTAAPMRSALTRWFRIFCRHDRCSRASQRRIHRIGRRDADSFFDLVTITCVGCAFGSGIECKSCVYWENAFASSMIRASSFAASAGSSVSMETKSIKNSAGLVSGGHLYPSFLKYCVALCRLPM